MIYLLEDDDNIRSFVVYALNNSGFNAKGFALPTEFFKAAAEELPSLLLLDIMLPEENGLDILKKLKKSPDTASLPVILLTAKSTEYDRVIGLDSGADDYICKPFGTMELISRVRAVLRRCGAQKSDKIIIGDLQISPSRHEARLGELPLELSLKEFNLLCFLADNYGNVVTRDQILESVWGYKFDGENRTVDVHIRSLRAKLGESADIIKTIRGIGYKIG